LVVIVDEAHQRHLTAREIVELSGRDFKVVEMVKSAGKTRALRCMPVGR
jgi:hypothetical protein